MANALVVGLAWLSFFDIMPNAIAYPIRPNEILKWENATVPFVVHYGFSRDEVLEIYKVLREISQKTCVKFVTRSNQTDFVHIHKGPSSSGCYSFLGRAGGPQRMNLAMSNDDRRQFDDVNTCINSGNIAYLIMRTLGFYEEHLRPNRDEFVKINLRNVKTNKRTSFEKYSTAIYDWTTVSYDYGSVTHGGLLKFSTGLGETIVPIFGGKIGQRYGLSDGDISKIQGAYCNSCAKYLSPLCILSIVVLFTVTVNL